MLFTIFSAPNYCDMYGNLGSVMRFADKPTAGDEIYYSYEAYSAVEHPYVLPKGQNAITYSLPMVLTNVLTLVDTMMKMVGHAGEDDQDNLEPDSTSSSERVAEVSDAAKKEARREHLRNKILMYARMQTMLATLRSFKPELDEIRGMNDGKLPRGLISSSRAELEEAVQKYRQAREKDKENERLPGAVVVVTTVKLAKILAKKEGEGKEKEEEEREKSEAKLQGQKENKNFSLKK